MKYLIHQWADFNRHYLSRRQDRRTTLNTLAGFLATLLTIIVLARILLYQ